MRASPCRVTDVFYWELVKEKVKVLFRDQGKLVVMQIILSAPAEGPTASGEQRERGTL